jgi:hypothetical protein
MVSLGEVQRTEEDVSICQFFHDLESFDKVKDMMDSLNNVENGEDFGLRGSSDEISYTITLSVHMNQLAQHAIKLAAADS